MVDCEKGNREFKDMPLPRRESLQRRFIEVLIEYKDFLIGTATGIALEPYNRLRPRFKALRQLRQGLPVSGSLDHPYYLVAQSTAEFLSNHASQAEIPQEERIAFVFDRNHLGGRIPVLFQSIAHSTLPFHHRIGGVAFDDTRRVKPLQIADVLAYEAFRFFHDTVLNGESERWQFTELKKALPNTYFNEFNEQSLTTLVEKMESGEPGYP